MKETDEEAWVHELTQALEAGEADRALEIAEARIAGSPDDPYGYIYAGSALSALGRREDAVARFEKAIELSEDSASAWHGLGLTLDESSEAPRAFEALQRAAALDQEVLTSPTFLFRRAHVLIALSQFSEAQADLAQLREISPDVSEVSDYLFTHAVISNNLGQFDDALAYLDKTRQITPELEDDAGYALQRGLALNGLGRAREALEFLDRAAELAPELGQIWVFKSQAHLANAELDDADAAVEKALALGTRLDMEGLAWILKAQISVARGDSVQALAAAERASGIAMPAPLAAAARLITGELLAAQGRADEAKEAFNQATALLPAKPDAWVAWANLLVTSARAEEALELVSAALSHVADDRGRAALLLVRAKALSRLGRAAEAGAALEESAALATGLEFEPDTIIATVDVLTTVGRSDDALAFLSQAADQVPGLDRNPVLQNIRGNILLGLGRTDEAYEAFGQAAEVAPEFEENARAWFACGLARGALADHRRALSAMDRAAELDPRVKLDPTYQVLRVFTLSFTGSPEETLKAAEELSVRNPSFDFFVESAKATAFERSEDFESALGHLNRALEAAGSLPMPALLLTSTLVRKASVELRLKRLADAVASSDRALEYARTLPGNNPFEAFGLISRAASLFALGREDEALADTKEAVELSERVMPPEFPQRGAARLLEATLLSSVGRHEEALQAYNHLLRLEPDSVDGWVGKGETLLELEDPNALQAFEYATKLAKAKDPPDQEQVCEALLGKGRALAGAGLDEDALEAYREASEVQPDNRLVWEELASAYSRLGRHRAERYAFQRGWALGERSGRFALKYSARLLNDGDYEEALRILDEARPGAVGAHIQLNRGIALEKLGRPEEAREAWLLAARDGIPRAAEYAERVAQQRATPVAGAWIDFWLAGKTGAYRRIVGVCLLLVLAFLTVALLVNPQDATSLSWLRDDQEWEIALAPLILVAVLLILPSVRRLSAPGGVSIEAFPTTPELPPQSELVPEISGDLSRRLSNALPQISANQAPGLFTSSLRPPET